MHVWCVHMYAPVYVCVWVRSGHQLSYSIILSYESLRGPGTNCQPESPSDPPVSDPTVLG